MLVKIALFYIMAVTAIAVPALWIPTIAMLLLAIRRRRQAARFNQPSFPESAKVFSR